MLEVIFEDIQREILIETKQKYILGYTKSYQSFKVDLYIYLKLTNLHDHLWMNAISIANINDNLSIQQVIY